MIFGRQASDKSTSRLATARYDGESADQGGPESQQQVASQFRLAMILRIPVGYQDETGFHRGEPRMYENLPVLGPEDRMAGRYQF